MKRLLVGDFCGFRGGKGAGREHHLRQGQAPAPAQKSAALGEAANFRKRLFIPAERELGFGNWHVQFPQSGSRSRVRLRAFGAPAARAGEEGDFREGPPECPPSSRLPARRSGILGKPAPGRKAARAPAPRASRFRERRLPLRGSGSSPSGSGGSIWSAAACENPEALSSGLRAGGLLFAGSFRGPPALRGKCAPKLAGAAQPERSSRFRASRSRRNLALGPAAAIRRIGARPELPSPALQAFQVADNARARPPRSPERLVKTEARRERPKHGGAFSASELLPPQKSPRRRRGLPS